MPRTKDYDKKVRKVNKGQSASKKIAAVHAMVESLVKSDSDAAAEHLHTYLQLTAREILLGEKADDKDDDDKDDKPKKGKKGVNPFAKKDDKDDDDDDDDDDKDDDKDSDDEDDDDSEGDDDGSEKHEKKESKKEEKDED